jgi:hypothetical protein
VPDNCGSGSGILRDSMPATHLAIGKMLLNVESIAAKGDGYGEMQMDG